MAKEIKKTILKGMSNEDFDKEIMKILETCNNLGDVIKYIENKKDFDLEFKIRFAYAVGFVLEGSGFLFIDEEEELPN